MKPNTPGLQNYWQSLLLLLLPAIALATLFYLLVVPGTNSEATEQFARGAAELQAASIDSNLEQVAAQLDGLSRLPELRRLLVEGNHAELQRLGAQWTLLFGQVDRLEVVALGELGVAGLDGVARAALRNNIEKDMLHRAINSDDAVIDVYRLDGRYVLSITKAVVAGNRKIGALLLSLQSSWLADKLASVETSVLSSATTALFYQGGSAPDKIIGEVLPDGALIAEQPLRKLPGTSLRYSVAEKLSVGLLSAAVVAAGAGLLVLLGVIGLGRLRGQMAAGFEDEASQLKRYVGEAFENQPERPELEFESLGNVLQGFDAALAKFREKVDLKPSNGSQPDKEKPAAAPAELAPAALASDMEVEEAPPAPPMPPAHVFRAYDIRGVAGEDLIASHVTLIGQAIGSAARDAGNDTVVLGRDGRLSSEEFADALAEGLLAAGVDVVEIGLVPTPVLYFAVEQLQAGAGVMVTGSHNAPEYNGFKIVIGGQALVDEQITGLYDRIASQSLAEGQGSRSTRDMVDAYIDHIVDDVVFASSVKVVLDCGNGAASEIAPMLFASMGAEVVPLFAEVDGNFPNHLPDPGDAANLQALISEVAEQQADLGLAFDGDADRVVAVTASGQVVEADSLMMLFARDVLTRNPGADVVYDQKCSRNLSHLIGNYGGRPVMWKSGHSRIKQKMQETGALLGGEYSGHFFFKERWFGFDDGLYSGARLVEMLTLDGSTLDQALEQLPDSASSPEITIPVDEEAKFELVKLLQQSSQFDDGEKSTLDGLRVDFAEGWGLVRASNTGPRLTARFEADTDEALASIKQRFGQALADVGVSLPG